MWAKTTTYNTSSFLPATFSWLLNFSPSNCKAAATDVFQLYVNFQYLETVRFKWNTNSRIMCQWCSCFFQQIVNHFTITISCTFWLQPNPTKIPHADTAGPVWIALYPAGEFFNLEVSLWQGGICSLVPGKVPASTTDLLGPTPVKVLAEVWVDPSADQFLEGGQDMVRTAAPRCELLTTCLHYTPAPCPPLALTLFR